MQIEAKVNLLSNSQNNVKALASITIEDCFVVTGIRIIESSNGSFFSAMPSRKTVNGDYKDICFPITAEARAAINDEILKAYYEKVGQSQDNVQENNFNNDFDYGFSDSDLPF